jgi:hypothetical protein
LTSNSCFESIVVVDVSIGRISTTKPLSLNHLWLLVMMVSVMLFGGS